jgi:hypothetical protein
LSETFRIVTKGLMAGAARDVALTQLAALFKCSAGQVEPMLAGTVVTVKKGLEVQAASRYKRALEMVGLRADIEPENGIASAFSAAMVARDAGNFELARDLYLVLAQNGEATACYNLGALYSDDGGLVPSDRQEAYKWIAIAGKCGDDEAADTLARLESAMDYTELSNARQRTGAWLARYRAPAVAHDKCARFEQVASQGCYSVDELNTLRPRLRPAGDSGNGAHFLRAGDLVCTYYMAAVNGGADLSERDIHALCMEPDELHAMSVDNLMRTVMPSYQLAHLQQVPEFAPGEKLEQFHYIKTGADVSSACLLLPALWNAARPLVKGELRVVVPNQGDCYFCGAEEIRVLNGMAEVARRRKRALAEGGLSSFVYGVDEHGNLRCVSENKALADPQPAPGAAASSHFASDPGNIILSEARLFKLRPELHDPQEDLNVRRTLVDSIAAHLRSGDARAAVVIDAAKGIVAAYTDEMDCVALLRFERPFVINERWKNGTRLLTVNRYAPKEYGMAPDLTPAPGMVTEFGNFMPLIADLLTNERQALDIGKARISEAEWKRTLELGQALWRAGRVAPRDGTPLRSDKPAPVCGAQRQAEPDATQEKLGLESAAKALGGALVSFFFLWHVCKVMIGIPIDKNFFLGCFAVLALFGLGVFSSMRLVRWARQ